MQGSDSKCTGISVPARTHAISVVGYIAEAKTIFAFNVTYNRQAQKALQAISEKIENSIENKSFIKLWKILPHKESYGGTLITPVLGFLAGN